MSEMPPWGMRTRPPCGGILRPFDNTVPFGRLLPDRGQLQLPGPRFVS